MGMARVQWRASSHRVPHDARRVLRALDEAGLLGNNLFVIGTNSIYAYEIKSGVLFDSGLLATTDFDLLWDAKDRLRLAVSKITPEGVLGVLKQADPTYSSGDDFGFEPGMPTVIRSTSFARTLSHHQNALPRLTSTPFRPQVAIGSLKRPNLNPW